MPKNEELALRWYRLAAEQGNATAQNNLGGMHESGKGIARNNQTAVKWFKTNALQPQTTRFLRVSSWLEKPSAPDGALTPVSAAQNKQVSNSK